MALNKLTETELEEIEQRATMAEPILGDPEVAKRYAKLASSRDVPALIKEVRRMQADRGGQFGEELRELVRDWIVKAPRVSEADQKIALQAEAEVASTTVHAAAGQVVVDVRLIMRLPQ